MPKNRQVTEALIGYLLLLWCASVFAANGSAFAEGMRSITREVVLGVLVLSGAGGLAGTLSKVCNPDKPIKNVALEMAKDMVGSIVLGTLVFCFTAWIEWLAFWAQAGLIIVAGVGGSKALDRLVESRLNSVLDSLLDRVLGKPKDGAS